MPAEGQKVLDHVVTSSTGSGSKPRSAGFSPPSFVHVYNANHNDPNLYLTERVKGQRGGKVVSVRTNRVGPVPQDAHLNPSLKQIPVEGLASAPLFIAG